MMDKVEKLTFEFKGKDWSNIDMLFESKNSISIPTIKEKMFFYNNDTYLEIELNQQKVKSGIYLLLLNVNIISDNILLDSYIYGINDYDKLSYIYNLKQSIDDCDFNIYFNINRLFGSSFSESFNHKKEHLDKNTTMLDSKEIFVEQLQNLLTCTDFKDNKDLIFFCYFLMLKPEYIIGNENLCDEILLKLNYYNYCDNFDNTDLIKMSIYNLLNYKFLDTEEVIIEKATKYIELVCKCAKDYSKVILITDSLKNKKLENFRNEVYYNFYTLYE